MERKDACRILATTKNYKSDNINNCKRITEIYNYLYSSAATPITNESIHSLLREALTLKGMPDVERYIDNVCSKNIQLFCFPFAGGASDFYKKWNEGHMDHFRIELLDYPGRGRKIREPFVNNFDSMINILTDEIANRIKGTFAFFGHSLGAMLAYEIAKNLYKLGMSPKCVFLSGCPAPHLIKREPMHELSDDEFIRKLIALGGIPNEFAERPEYLNAFLPSLRSDFSLIDSYIPDPRSITDIPFVVFTGNEDLKVTESEACAWSEYTNNSFNFHVFNGNHFFVNNEQPILDKIVDYLGEP